MSITKQRFGSSKESNFGQFLLFTLLQCMCIRFWPRPDEMVTDPPSKENATAHEKFKSVGITRKGEILNLSTYLLSLLILTAFKISNAMQSVGEYTYLSVIVNF